MNQSEGKRGRYILCLWPVTNSAEIQKKAEELLAQSGCRVLETKEYDCSYRQFCDIIYLAYQNMPWATSPHCNGVLRKATWCRQGKKRLTLLIVESSGCEPVIGVKLRLRELYQLGYHCAHSVDEPEETGCFLDQVEEIVRHRDLYSRNLSWYLRRWMMQCAVFVRKARGKIDE